MANWKKVVVSGSSAELAGLTVDATITGDISGVAGSVLAANVTGAGSAITADTTDFLASSVTTISSAQATKLSNIETAADVTDTTNVVAALTAGTNVAIAANGTISSTDTNTQLSTADVRGKLSGAGSVSYNTSTGVITGTDTNTQLSDAEVIAALTAGTNVTISAEGVIASSFTDTNTQLSTADVRGKFTAGTNVTITDGVIASSFTDTNTQLSDAEVIAALTAGDNVTISAEGVISSTDTNTNTQLSDTQVRSKFTGGTNVSISATGVISSTDTDTQLSTADVRGKFTAGTNVTITDGVIASSFTDTNTQRTDSDIRNVTATQLVAGDNVTLVTEGEGIIVSSIDTNTQLSTADVRGKFSAGANVTINNGVIASSFTNTNDDVSVANLKARLAGGFGSNAVQIGDVDDIVTIGNKLVVAGDLVVNGATTTVNTANLNIEDSFILLASGSAERVDAGIIFNNQAAGTGDSFFYDSQSGRPSWAESVAFNATVVTPSAYIPRVYDVDADMTPVAERGSIKVEGQDIFMYS